MSDIFSEERYEEMIQGLFQRFPSFQKVGAGAYKPGIANMEFFDQLAGHPHRNYKVIHVAGTNGKGSVSNMLASCLSAAGLKVGLYTSPHILDFRERIRVCHPEHCTCDSERCNGVFRLIPKADVWAFVRQWQETFDHLDMSFFEITTSLALSWFATQQVDVAVLETGLGGRLDSTNIITPVLSVITNIGLDHCDMLGETLPEIAFEKAGIIKPQVPVVVGESNPETDPVFERKVLYTNLSDPSFMGSRSAVMSLLTFADKVQPRMWERHEEILAEMDLQGDYQKKNLRTVLAALDVLAGIGRTSLGIPCLIPPSEDGPLTQTQAVRGRSLLEDALIHTSRRTGFGGRWEKLCEDPWIICDIGHNGHGLKYNFAQLSRMKSEGKCTDLIVVYGSVADKDLDAVIHLMPSDAVYVFTQAHGKRALPAEAIHDRYYSFCDSCGRVPGECHVCGDVSEAVRTAIDISSGVRKADPAAVPLIYIGGSTYVVSEAVSDIVKHPLLSD